MIRLLVALFVASVATAGDTPVRTVHTYADGRRVVVEDTIIPARTVRTVTELPPPVTFVRRAVLVEDAPVVVRSAPILYTAAPVLYTAPPVLLVPRRTYSTPVRDFFFGR